MRPFLAAFLLVLALPLGCNEPKRDTADNASGNTPPIATAGPDITIPADRDASLDAHGSYDPDGDTITYHWSFEHLPSGSRLDAKEAPFSRNKTVEAVTTGFTPDAVGTYVVALKVHDGKVYSTADYVIVTVTEPENRPVASAGPDQVIAIGSSVGLDGSASYDPQGRVITYAWTLADVPTGSGLSSASLSGATTTRATLAPDVKGVYIVNLVVNNGLTDSLPDSATVTVTGENGAPTANAGPDIAGEDCTWLNLDCSASVDPDGDALSYFWEIQSKPAGSVASTASFGDRNAARTTFWADVAGDYVFSCAVNDSTYWSTPDTVNASVGERSYNAAPTVAAGADRTEAGGTTECVEDGYSYDCDACADMVTTLGDGASVSDPDGDPTTFSWTVVSGDATIADASLVQTTVTLTGAAPTEPGSCEDTVFEFQLAASDCTGAGSSDNVTITVTCCGAEVTTTKKGGAAKPIPPTPKTPAEAHPPTSVKKPTK